MHWKSVHPISESKHYWALKHRPSTIIIDDFNTLLSPTDRSSRQETNKETSELNDTIYQMDLADIYRIFHQTIQNTFFSAAHRTVSKIDNLGHKASLSKYK
jgi:hypothetical protein